MTTRSKEMYNALLEAGKTVEFVHYPREGHGILEPRHREDELRRIAAWFWNYIPTHKTPEVVGFGNWAEVSEASARIRVTGVRVTEDYRKYGETFNTVVEVEVEMEPLSAVPSEGCAAAARAKTTQSSAAKRDEAGKGEEGEKGGFKAGGSQNDNVFLLWTGADPYQRPSAIAPVKAPVDALAVGPSPESALFFTGEMEVRAAQRQRLRWLFVKPPLQWGDISKLYLSIGDKDLEETKLSLAANEAAL
uniref:prolyl oligopeptidase family serine peptidase n=1 Tax=Alicyclobacillus tolerans TaxID=90970 RepID=UPI001F025A94|nr:prolyl oligopeptidase family serine peptidase [Alicyclobacillus tolerans]